MKLQIWYLVLIISGIISKTLCRYVVSTENWLRNEIRKRHLEVEFISTGSSFLFSDLTDSLAVKNAQNQSSNLVNDLRAGLTGYNISDTCLNHTEILTQALLRRDQWSIRFIDAAGKLGSGILDGNINWPGSYDECINTQAVVYENQTTKSRPSYPFWGKYCMVGIQFPSTNIPQLFGGPPTLSLGICVPESCNNDDAEALVRKAFSFLPPNLTKEIDPVLNCHERDPEFDGRALAVIIVASIIGIIIVVGTAYDVVTMFITRDSKRPKMTDVNGFQSITTSNHRNNEDVNDSSPLLKETKNIDYEVFGRDKNIEVHSDSKIVSEILMAFSLYRNAAKILGTSQAAGSLKAANGIRFISMSWIILGHSFAFGVGQGSNLGSFVPKVLNRFTFQAVNNASLSVDTFFVLSGLLLAYLTLRELNKFGDVRKFRWGMFYFHRFWRLTPPYMLLLMVYVPTFKYWSDGPYWPKDGPELEYCHDTWWTNLLYINNFVNVDKMCMPWSWYLANDMQFFLVSPILLIALYRSPRIGGILSGVALVSTWTASGVLASVNNVSANLLGQPDTFGFRQLYVKPYCRMGPYIIGILTGFVLYKTNCKFKVNRVLNLAGWLIASGVALSVLYGLFNPNNEHTLSTGVSALYISVAKTAWGVAVAWVIFACATGNGGIVDTALSWDVFVPLGRLTYCAYLVHPLAMYFYYLSRRSTIVFNDIQMSYLYVGHLVFAYAAAFVLSLAFESPMMALEKVLFKREKRN